MEINGIIYFIFVLVAVGCLLDAWESGIDWHSLIFEREEEDPPYLCVFLVAFAVTLLIISFMWNLI